MLGSGGSSQPYARGLGGYQVDYAGEPEAYVAVAAGQRDDTLGCTFNRDSTFVLDVSKTAGVIRVDAAGVKTRFADIPADGVNGITFDTTGKFGNRLIVTGPKQGKTAIYTIDCTGKVHAVTETAPTPEGGIVVAPAGFTGYGGALIAPDELSGKIYAIDQDGGVRLVATSTLATGGDIGVESGGFIPAGFSANSGYVYVADRSTPGNPHPGTDTLLRLSAADLKPTGVNDGDLLIATEGGDLLEAVHCAATCTIRQVADAPRAGGARRGPRAGRRQQGSRNRRCAGCQWLLAEPVDPADRRGRPPATHRRDRRGPGATAQPPLPGTRRRRLAARS